MVRSVVGILVEVGRGRRRASDVDWMLQRGDRSRVGGVIAPPQGLCLVAVDYDDLTGPALARPLARATPERLPLSAGSCRESSRHATGCPGGRHPSPAVPSAPVRARDTRRGSLRAHVFAQS